ncbi:MAG: CHRD domain-containing protein [Chitinophagaceae bacterium]|nr:CHRD domain-containing protein [Rubrivivax sp.]
MSKFLISAAAALAVCVSIESNAAGTYVGTLLGSNEIGTTGDLDALGTVVAIIDAAGKVDVTFSFANLAANLTGAHIHRGAAGLNGPIIIDFNPPSIGAGNGFFSFTTSVTDNDAFEINDTNASGYYFNLHTTDFPAGAIRGQLVAAVPEPETYALMFAGLVSIGAVVRRRKLGKR